MRANGRGHGQIRPVGIQVGVNKYAEGSVLISMGDTRVLCTATIQPKVPGWLRGKGGGWVTAEYSLLPRSTQDRTAREAARGKQSGRTQEIQRLIGRSLRAAVDLQALGECSIVLDCDVLQADGGTRTASITGAYVALVQAIASRWDGEGLFPVRDYCAAVSVGKVGGEILLDLCYDEDSAADADVNIVMLGDGTLAEIQGTGEGTTFSRAELTQMLDYGESGIRELMAAQQQALGELADLIGSKAETAIILATHNAGKIREFQAALATVGYAGIPIAELTAIPEPEETGTTFAENARLKANYYMQETGLPALADDSGLVVDALGGAPGIYSARYAGVHGDDAANNRKLVAALADVPPAERTAHYECALALVWPDGHALTGTGRCSGRIVDTPQGTGGFGYDPHFWLDDRGCTMAEIDLDEKNRISHRGEALRQLLAKIEARDGAPAD